MTFKEPESQVCIWIKLLTDNEFDIEHFPDKQHVYTDALSFDPDSVSAVSVVAMWYPFKFKVDVVMQQTHDAIIAEILA